jgi:chromosome segregation ATPase
MNYINTRKALIEDYERRLKSVAKMLQETPQYEDLKKERLRTKAAAYRSFLAELKASGHHQWGVTQNITDDIQAASKAHPDNRTEEDKRKALDYLFPKQRVEVDIRSLKAEIESQRDHIQELADIIRDQAKQIGALKSKL